MAQRNEIVADFIDFIQMINNKNIDSQSEYILLYRARAFKAADEHALRIIRTISPSVVDAI